MYLSIVTNDIIQEVRWLECCTHFMYMHTLTFFWPVPILQSSYTIFYSQTFITWLYFHYPLYFFDCKLFYKSNILHIKYNILQIKKLHFNACTFIQHHVHVSKISQFKYFTVIHTKKILWKFYVNSLFNDDSLRFSD